MRWGKGGSPMEYRDPKSRDLGKGEFGRYVGEGKRHSGRFSGCNRKCSHRKAFAARSTASIPWRHGILGGFQKGCRPCRYSQRSSCTENTSTKTDPAIWRKGPETDMMIDGQGDASRISSYCRWLQVSDKKSRTSEVTQRASWPYIFGATTRLEAYHLPVFQGHF